MTLLTVALDHQVAWPAASVGFAVQVQVQEWQESAGRAAQGDSDEEQQGQRRLSSVFHSLRRTGYSAQLLDRMRCMRRWRPMVPLGPQQLTTRVGCLPEVGFRIADRSDHREWRAIDILDNSAFGTSAYGRDSTAATVASTLKGIARHT